MKQTLSKILLSGLFGIFLLSRVSFSEEPFADKRWIDIELKDLSEKIVTQITSINSIRAKGTDPKAEVLSKLTQQLEMLRNYSSDKLNIAVGHYAKSYVSAELLAVKTSSEKERQAMKNRATAVHEYIEKLWSAIEDVKAKEEREKQANKDAPLKKIKDQHSIEAKKN